MVAFVAMLSLCESTAQASGSGFEILDEESAEGMLVGLVAVPVVWLSYGIAGVDFDGLLVPPEIGWPQLAITTLLLFGTAALVEDSTVESVATVTGSGVLGVHAAISLLAYAPEPEPAAWETSGLKLVPDPRGGARLVWSALW